MVQVYYTPRNTSVNRKTIPHIAMINADYEYQTTVANVVSIARRAKTIFENSSDVAGKRQFLNYLLQNPTVKDKKLCFTIASPFDSVLELTDSSNWLSSSS